jgi:hypothetical protein
MIQINLLPPEYRPRPGTPAARFIAIVVGVVLLACTSGAYAYTHFIELTKVKELKSVREEEVRAKELQRDRSQALQREIDVYENRRSAIQMINRSRVLWSRKLDQFYDIVTSQGNDETYSVWLDTLEVPPQPLTTKRKGKAVKRGEQLDGGVLRFVGFMAMENDAEGLALSSAFFKALTGDPDATGRRTDFFGDFLRINNPNLEIVNNRRVGEVELIPPVMATFNYELTLKAPDADTKPVAAPAKKKKN